MYLPLLYHPPPCRVTSLRGLILFAFQGQEANEPKLATLDHRHFHVLRPRHVDALRLLPEE
ncbi:MAG: hypothetical protein HW388_251 [Dehalococcoidia bacterium]|nr:hypothetical protein [Dehalococcoidia bacterium]